MSSFANGYTRKWLTAVNKNPKPFGEELFTTTFSTENVQKVISETKAGVDAKIESSLRYVDEDYYFMLQLTSFVRPHAPIHLLRM